MSGRKLKGIASRRWTIVLAGLFLCQASVAEHHEAQVLRVAYEEAPPYSFTDASGAARGYSIDLLAHLIRPMGHSLQFVATQNTDQQLALLRQGEIELTSLLELTERHKAEGLASDPVGQYETSMFVLESSTAQRPSDLSGFLVGAVAGSFAAKAVARIPFARLVTYQSSDALVMPLLSGTVDAVAAQSETFLSRLRHAEIDDLVRRIDPALKQSARGFIVRRDRPDLVAGLNSTIAGRLSNGELLLLNQRWFGRPKPLIEQPQFLWHAITIGLLSFALSILSWVACNSFLRARQARSEMATNRLLLDALNGIDAAIVIFDSELRATDWNEGFTNAFSSDLRAVRNGQSLQDMLALSYQADPTKPDDNTETATGFAARIIENLRAGQDTARLIHLANGRVYEAHEFPIGPSHFAAVRVDVTHMHAQSAEILRQQGDLKLANEKLNVFSSIAAHDLKAPLHQQIALLDFIREDLNEAGFDLPEDVVQNFDHIQQVSDKLVTLVQDLLDHARAQGPSTDVSAIDPSSRLQEVVALAAIPEGFAVDISPDIPRVTVSATAFDTVMRNLISNAAKHHDRDTGTIRIRGARMPGGVVLEVEDDGPGIPVHCRKKIFEPFERLPTRKPVKGSGLGLSFIQRTTESWGGTITVESAEHRGSIFRLSIPDVHPMAERDTRETPPRHNAWQAA